MATSKYPFCDYLIYVCHTQYHFDEQANLELHWQLQSCRDASASVTRTWWCDRSGGCLAARQRVRLPPSVSRYPAPSALKQPQQNAEIT